MFNDIGGKIKTLAKVICWVGIIGSVIVGLIMMTSDGDKYGPLGLGVLIGGSLFSWIGSFFAYGFGEIIEKVTEIAKNTAKTDSAPSKTDEMTATLNKWKAQGLINEEEYLEQLKKRSQK